MSFFLIVSATKIGATPYFELSSPSVKAIIRKIQLGYVFLNSNRDYYAFYNAVYNNVAP